jgi:two-component system OmpR family response regulator
MAAARQGSELVVGDLVLDEDSHEVRRADELVELTATEFELLRFLMRNPKRVLSKAQILDRVWNYDFGGQSNVVELYISYLRKKIDAGRSPMIHTVRGAGYVLKPGRSCCGHGRCARAWSRSRSCCWPSRRS